MNGTENEFIMSFGLKENKGILEKVLGLELVEVKLEKKYEGFQKNFMIDIYALEKNSNIPVYVENILTVSDGPHQTKLLEFIDNIETGIIVYQAPDFLKMHVIELREAVKGKNINLYFVKINKSAIDLSKILNSKVHKLLVYNHLNMFNNIQNPLELLTEISIIKPLKGKIEPMEENIENMERYLKNTYLIDRLRSTFPYFFSFQREKSNIDKIPTLRFGAGKADINLYISVESKNWAFVELSFAKKSKKIFHIIKEKEERAKKLIGNELEFVNNKHKIIYRFKARKSVVETVDILIPIAEKFIQAFSNYTYYPDEPEMWEEFDYSL
ncbi:hypothetical protein [Rummeliibacillus pycnus]|uniref:hypothetical protein n=1 Tax=Rummeliibacillus pycnus TaxID=101070 RepID=UPI000C9ADE34|nr:hypothetical protein [Rummeliibacillus pycnus]